jgi:hypothetical protein
MAAGSYAYLRASVTDRDRAIEVVKTSFAEGRLTKEELDLRIGHALAARYFPELMALIADLPVGPFGRLPWHPPTPAPSPMRWPRRIGAVVLGCLVVLIAAAVTCRQSVACTLRGHVRPDDRAC